MGVVIYCLSWLNRELIRMFLKNIFIIKNMKYLMFVYFFIFDFEIWFLNLVSFFSIYGIIKRNILRIVLGKKLLMNDFIYFLKYCI